MKYTTSINIERDGNKNFHYIVTANAKRVMSNIIHSYNVGIHSFTLIGSYGTGKSSFILALEDCLAGRGRDCQKLMKIEGQFNGCRKFHFLNIVGGYNALADLITAKIGGSADDFFDNFDNFYQKIAEDGKFLVIVVDEFGKVLEYASKNCPERSMYFLQQLAEYVNDTSKNILLLTTLHQGFGAYSKGLQESQRQEWTKVKGRFVEIVFREPVEQLLDLAVRQLENKNIQCAQEQEMVYDLAVSSKLFMANLSKDVAIRLYPMDIVAAHIFVNANQKYGQNERTFFSFLHSEAEDAVSQFVPKRYSLYNLSNVYDYISYHFYSYISETNVDSTQWRSIRIALDKVESANWSDEDIISSTRLIKAIGLLNIFAPAAVIDEHFLEEYARLTMSVSNSKQILKKLVDCNVVRYAKYKSKYILVEGTDVDIDAGLLDAERYVEKGTDVVEKLNEYFTFPVLLANEYYYKIGTPRYFEYHITEQVLLEVAQEEADGYINLLFPSITELDNVRNCVLKQSDVAIIYCLFKNVDTIANILYQLKKLQWVRNNYITDSNDKVALREIETQMVYERERLSQVIQTQLFDANCVDWYFNGKQVRNILNHRQLLGLLSQVCTKIYDKTPVFKNELVNKIKTSTSIAIARPILLNRLLENVHESDLGFCENTFPPEKSIYITLLKENEMHRNENGTFVLSSPRVGNTFHPLWQCCISFLKSTVNKQRRLGELITILKQSPFRLKQGLIDLWLPIFLIITKDDYALYSDGSYVPYITQEVLELLQRKPNQFSIKSFSLNGVKMSFFHQYRMAMNLDVKSRISNDSFIETIRPFLTFYKRLNDYAKNTKKLTPQAKNLRDVIATATDPEKTFFEILPERLGFKDVTIEQDPEIINNFVNVLQEAFKNLRNCYDELIDTVESKIVSILRLSSNDYNEYKAIVNIRYSNVKKELMPLSLKNFYSRVVSNFNDKREWVESMSYVLLNKPLSSIRDDELPFLFDAFQSSFFALDDYVEMHKSDDTSTVRFHLVRNNEKMLTKQIVLNDSEQEQIRLLQQKIENLLGSDETLNISALLNILKEKME